MKMNIWNGLKLQLKLKTSWCVLKSAYNGKIIPRLIAEFLLVIDSSIVWSIRAATSSTDIFLETEIIGLIEFGTSKTGLARRYPSECKNYTRRSLTWNRSSSAGNFLIFNLPALSNLHWNRSWISIFVCEHLTYTWHFLWILKTWIRVQEDGVQTSVSYLGSYWLWDPRR